MRKLTPIFLLGYLLITVNTGCSEKTSTKTMYQQMQNEYLDCDSLTNAAVAKTEEDLKKLYGFRPCMVGGGIAGGLQRVTLWGDMPRSYTIEEARRIAVNGAIIFRNNINSVKKLRPAMRIYPFPYPSITLDFFPPQAIKKSFVLQSLYAFGLARNLISYDIIGSDGHLQTIKEEPFAEAQRIVEEERAQQGITAPLSLPVSQLKEIVVSHKKNRPQFEGIPREVKIQRFLQNFCTDLGKEHKLIFLWTGDFSDTFKGIYYGISFYGFESHPLEESRQLVHALYRKYYTLLQTSPVVKEFQVLHRTEGGFINTPDIPPLSEACLKITFWDDNFNPQMPPNIAQVTFLDGKFSYYQADPVTHELTLIYQELYEAPQNKEAT